MVSHQATFPEGWEAQRGILVAMLATMVERQRHVQSLIIVNSPPTTTCKLLRTAPDRY